jgi:hypothetical protein
MPKIIIKIFKVISKIKKLILKHSTLITFIKWGYKVFIILSIVFSAAPLL